MQKYVKTYCDFFGYVEDEFIPSELSGSPAQDVHHIKYKSRLGTDNIENLIALTREEHNDAHTSKYTEELLQEAHNKFIYLFNKHKKRNGKFKRHRNLFKII